MKNGKGYSTIRFAMNFEETGKFRGVQLNRGRVVTCNKRQARLEEYGIIQPAREDNTTVTKALFGPFNFYCDAVADAFNERFSVF